MNLPYSWIETMTMNEKGGRTMREDQPQKQPAIPT